MDLLLFSYIGIAVESHDLRKNIGNYDHRKDQVRELFGLFFRKHSDQTGKRCVYQLIDTVQE